VTAAVDEWRQTSLRDVVTKLVDGSHNPPSKQESGFPMLSARNVENGRIVFDEFRYIEKSTFEQEDKRTQITAGDVLLTIVGTIGRAAVVPHGLEPFALQRSVAVLSPKSELLPRFLCYQLQAPRVQRYFEENARGTAQKGVYLKTLGATPVVVPSVSTQESVVAEIEKQFSRLDEAVANLQRVKANLKRYKAAVLKAAVEGCLVETEGGWRQSVLGAEGLIIGGFTKNQKRNDLPLKLPYLRVANVYANELRLEEVEYIGVAEKELEKLLVRKGDLLVVEGNGSPDQIGRVALWNDAIPNCVHQNHLIKVRLGDAVIPEWALIWMLSPIGRHEIEQVSASTSGLHTLSVGKVSRLPIGVPCLKEQALIVAEVDRRLSIIREVEAEVDANLQRAQTLKSSVLSRAFSGEGAARISLAQDEHVAHLPVVVRAVRFESASVVMAAKVLDALAGEPTMGRVKLQKIVFLATYHGKVESANAEYVRMQAGPLDMPMLEGVIKRLNNLGWFRETARNGKSSQAAYSYASLTKAGEHRKHLAALTAAQIGVIDQLVKLMRTWSTEQCELLATVYGAWNDLLIWKQSPTVDAIANEVLENWHEAKRKFSRQKISQMIEEIKHLGIEPSGFGLPTSGSVPDQASRSLFED
jgi:type I restriction enzyme S subunit